MIFSRHRLNLQSPQLLVDQVGLVLDLTPGASCAAPTLCVRIRLASFHVITYQTLYIRAQNVAVEFEAIAVTSQKQSWRISGEMLLRFFGGRKISSSTGTVEVKGIKPREHRVLRVNNCFEKPIL